MSAELPISDGSGQSKSDNAPGAGTSPESEPLPGAKLHYFGDYELLEEIARGGMGVVYKARQLSLNRLVALKMILSGQLASEAEVKRFRTEAEAAASLDHPNIVPIYEVGEHEGRHYFAMRLVEGGNLANQISRFKDDLKAAAVLTANVARAVHHAHQRGILHRDLKPSNILVGPDGQPYVTDFGLARLVKQDSDLTHTGCIVGTPNYMAPEQALGKTKQLTTTSDVFSLGAILYQMLTGQVPFQAETPLETVKQVVETEPQRPSSVNRRVDPDLETICLKCLAKDPQRRYGSAEALADDLHRWVKHETISARPATTRERAVKWIRRHRIVFAAATAVTTSLILGLGSSTWLFLNEKEARKRAEAAEFTQGQLRQRAEASENSARAEGKRAEAAAVQAKVALAANDFQEAIRLVAEDRASDALAYLARSLSANPTNDAAV